MATNGRSEEDVLPKENAPFIANSDTVSKVECPDPLLGRKQPPHLRMQNLKVHSPSDTLSPFSQKIIAERSNALKNLKPKVLRDSLLSVAAPTTSLKSGTGCSSLEESDASFCAPDGAEDCDDQAELEPISPSNQPIASNSPTANRSFTK